MLFESVYTKFGSSDLRRSCGSVLIRKVISRIGVLESLLGICVEHRLENTRTSEGSGPATGRGGNRDILDYSLGVA